MRNHWITIVLLFYALGAGAQCSNLKISVSQSQLCAPGIVKYQLTNAPAGSTFIWNVGKGNISGTDTFYGFYDQALVVNAQVTVTFPSGEKCTITKDSAVIVRAAPDPRIIASRTKLCNGPDTITLSTPTKGLKSISWVVDGINYYNQGPAVTHDFQSSGNKDVYLVVEDSFGCRASLRKTGMIQVLDPVELDFSADIRSGCVPQKVNFTPEINFNGEKAAAIMWTFDGASLTNFSGEQPPEMVYQIAGTYDVVLNLRTENGCLFELNREDYVGFGRSFKPEIEISNGHLCAKEEITIAGKPKMPGTYTFDLDGGQVTGQPAANVINARFADSGLYSVELVHDYNGCTSTASLNDTILVDFVEARFLLTDHYHCQVPHTTHLTQNSYTSNPDLDYQWNIFTAQTTNKVFTSDKAVDSFTTNWGIYDVQLIVTNNHGCSDTLTRPGYIRVDSIKPDFLAEPRIACIDQDIRFISKTPLSSYMSGDTFFWKWVDTDNVTLLGEDSGSNVTFSYSALGKYDVILYAGNRIGCRDSIRMEDYIEIVAPDLRFGMSDSLLCEGGTFTLTAGSKPVEADFKHEWRIVDQADSIVTGAQGNKVEMGSILPGIYHVRYKASIAGGCLDSIEKRNVLYINGVRAEILLDSTNGCTGLTVNAASSVIYDYHSSFPATGLTYRWFSEHGSDVIFSDPLAPATRVTFPKSGTYTVQLEVTNSAGCSYIAQSEKVVVGVSASYALHNKSVCAGDLVKVTQTASLNPTSLTWEIIPAGFDADITLDSDHNALIRPNEPGAFTLRLIAGKYGVCYDTFQREVTSHQVISSFVTKDSQLYCAPAYAQFVATSVGADSFFWDFGDGTKISTTSTNVANLYVQNSGWSKGYDVTLISKSNLGCSDTFTVADKVKVVGPVPEFEISNNEGCGPLEVEFENRSNNVLYYYLNYGDGSSLDSVHFGPHTYNTFSAAGSDTFVPSLYAVDSLGCVGIAESDKPVVVHKSPALDVVLSDSAGCVPFNLAFKEVNNQALAYKWYLDSALVSETSGGEEILLRPGSSRLVLNAFGGNGCRSDAVFSIEAFANPEIEITANGPVCIGNPVQFEIKDLSGTILESFDWMFGDETTMWDTSTMESPFWTYSTTGSKMVVVNVVTGNGCKASAAKNITLNDRNSIPKGKIDAVTFTESGDIEVRWQSVNTLRVQSSHLYRDDLVQPVSSSWTFGSELFTDNLPVPEWHCYRVAHRDVCGLEGDPESIHCPVWLMADNSEPFVITLNWTAYQGWDNIDVYEVYRQGIDGVKRIAVVKPDQLTYRDEKLCRGTYTYYIVARNNDLFSRSNTLTRDVVYVKDRTPKDISLVTVNNTDATIEITWHETQNPAFEKFVLRKSDPAAPGVILREFEVSGTTFKDYNVDINNRAYRYHLVEFDHCGSETPAGLPGTSVLLSGEYRGDASHLEWTPYEEWKEGVDRYVIQFRNENGFTDLAEVDGSTTRYIDATYHNDVRESFCYRVLAISGDSKDTSYSNITCTVGESRVYVPNSFTPNGDGLNETFRPVALFVKDWDDETFRDYRFAVYNRWGQRLFETTDLEQGWDGTYMGQDAPEGAYIYMLTLTGIDGKIHRKNGDVLLLR